MNKKVKSRIYGERLVREVLFGIFTVMLIVIIALFISGTVVSQGEGSITVDEEGYHMLEAEYVEALREYLNECGYENSGVNLTMMEDTDGNRRYSVKVYHRGICQLSDDARKELFQSMEEMAFRVMGCSFEISLLA